MSFPKLLMEYLPYVNRKQHFWWRRFGLLCQLAATVAVLGWIPGNTAKLIAMAVIWAVGFGRITAIEFLAMAGVNILFAVLNAAALAAGIFRFDHPDFFGMPVYEYLMWGFYTLHASRLLEGEPPRNSQILALLAAGAFALPFATIADPMLLLLVATIGLALCFVLFHEPMDWAYAGYMAAVGAAIEYTGVGTGQWHYPDQEFGSVPLWFLAMWAGVGLFTRRLLLPFLAGKGVEPLVPRNL
jgi:hypothetical protein